MNQRIVIVSVGVILVVLLAAFLLVSPGVSQPKASPIVDVLVARRDLPQGTLLDVRNMFIAKPLPRAEIPKDAVLQIESLQGKELTRPLLMHQICTRAHLERATALVLAAVKTDHRAGLKPGSNITLTFTPKVGDKSEQFKSGRIVELQDYPSTDGKGLTSLLMALDVGASDAKRIRELVASGKYTVLAEASSP